MNPEEDEFPEDELVFEPEDEFPEDTGEVFAIPTPVFPQMATPTFPNVITGQNVTFILADDLIEDTPGEQVWETEVPYDQGDDMPEGITMTEDGGLVFKSFHQLMIEITSVSADHIMGMIPNNNDYDWNLHGYNSPIRTAVSRFVLSYLDGLLDGIYRGIIANILHQRLWKEQESRHGEPFANALPLEIALDLIDDSAQREHVRDVSTQYFGLEVDDLTMVTLDMRQLEAMNIIPNFTILSPHSFGQRIADVNKVGYSGGYDEATEVLRSHSHLDHTERVSDLNDLDLQEYNLFVHAFGAAMVYGHIYLLDLGDEYCTFVAKSKAEKFDTLQLASFPEAMITFVENNGHLVRDITAFSAQYSSSHGVMAKGIESAVVDLVLLALEEVYAGRKEEAYKQDVANLRSQIKQAASQSNNAFGWS